MFRNAIQLTALTSPIAEEALGAISGESYSSDVTFVSTMRALLSKRIGSDSISLFCKHYREGVDTIHDRISSGGENELLNAILSSVRTTRSGRMTIVNIRGNEEESDLCFDAVEKCFEKNHEGFHELEKIRAFYRKSFRTICYVNPDIKSVILFVDNMNLRKYHYLQVSTLAFFPWYFGKDDTVSAEELALIYSLKEATPDKYEACIEKIAEQYNFAEMRIRSMLDGFEKRFIRLELEQVRSSISDMDSSIRGYESQIRDLMQKRYSLCTKMFGLQVRQDEETDDSEIRDYFLCNKKLFLEHVDDSSMSFSVKDYLTYFDQDMAERAIHNKHSYVYRYEGDRYQNIPEEQMERLMTELFLTDTPKLHIKLCAAYQFSISRGVNAMDDHNFDPVFAKDALPNPHIDRYSCLGNYGESINTLVRENNYIGAIEQCVASCKSLNFGDHTVMENFMRSMHEVGYRGRRIPAFIELPDGRMVTPTDAIKWLEEADKPAESEPATEPNLEAATTEAADTHAG